MASDAQLNIILQAQDKATSELAKVKESLGPSGFSGAIKGAMGVASGFILAQITMNAATDVKAFVSSAIKDFGELQAAQAQVSAVISSTGNYYHLTKAQADEYGKSLEKTSTFTQTQTTAAEALLLGYKNLSGQSIPDLLQTSADLATRFGMDLPEAARGLGRALQDPEHGARLLRQAGIALTTDLQKQIKTMQDSGNITGAQNLIMDQLRAKVAGASAAYGNTLPGEVAKAKRALEEFKIAAVGKVKTWIDNVDWGKITVDVGTMWKAVQPIVKDFEKYWMEVATVFEQNLLPDLERLWKALNPALTDALKIVAVLIGASIIVSLEAARIALIAIGDAMNWITDVIVAGANFFKAVWNDAMGFFKGIPGAIRTSWNGLSNVIQAPFKEAFNAIAKMWNDTLGKIDLKIPSWVPGIGGKSFNVPDIPMLATGTDSWPGGLAVLGEQGPELVNLPQGASVTPASETSKLITAANNNNQSNQTVNLQVTVGMYAGLPSEKRKIAVDLYTELVREARAHGVQLPQIGSASVQ